MQLHWGLRLRVKKSSRKKFALGFFSFSTLSSSSSPSACFIAFRYVLVGQKTFHFAKLVNVRGSRTKYTGEHYFLFLLMPPLRVETFFSSLQNCFKRSMTKNQTSVEGEWEREINNNNKEQFLNLFGFFLFLLLAKNVCLCSSCLLRRASNIVVLALKAQVISLRRKKREIFQITWIESAS